MVTENPELKSSLPLTVYCPPIVGIGEITAFFILQATRGQASNIEIVTPIDSQPKIAGPNIHSLFLQGNLNSSRLKKQTESDHKFWPIIRYYDHCRGKNPLKALEDRHFSTSLFETLTKIRLIYFDNPQMVLLEGSRALDSLYNNKLNPKTVEIIPGLAEYSNWNILDLVAHLEGELRVQELRERRILSESQSGILHLPVFKTNDPGERPIKGKTKTIELNKTRIRLLEGKHMRLVVGGPPGAGKSTATPTLVAEIKDIIKSMKSDERFADLNVTCEMVNLDKATPVSPHVATTCGQDRTITDSQKQAWTLPLANQAAREFAIASRLATLSIGDLPGRRTEITQILAGGADYGLILTPDWAEIKAWKIFFESLGIRVLIQARSRFPQEGCESAVRTYVSKLRGDERNYLGGRIVGLDRIIRRGDPFLCAAANLLLFDFLTQIDLGRRQKLHNMLQGIKEQFDPAFKRPPRRNLRNFIPGEERYR